MWHPDRFPGDAALQKKAEEKIKSINEAYRALKDGQERGAFFRPPPASGPPSAKPRRLRKLGLDLFVLALVLAAVFGMLFIIFHLKETSGRLRVRGITFKEWEWDTFFRPGSTKDEVLAVQGAPDRTEGSVWHYGKDSVTFADGRVLNYSNEQRRLRVRVLPDRPPAVAPEHFTIGSSKDEVLAVQGTPTRLAGDQWFYGEDSVLFSRGTVFEFSNQNLRLRVRIVPAEGTAVPADGKFGKGDSRDVVVAVQGTPTRVEGDAWYYGPDSVLFSKGAAHSVKNVSGRLRARIEG